MCLDTIRRLKVYGSCFEFSFHDTKTFFVLPSSVINSHNSRSVISEICADSIKSIVLFFFSNSVRINTVYFVFSNFVVIRTVLLVNETPVVICILFLSFDGLVSMAFCALSTCPFQFCTIV